MTIDTDALRKRCLVYPETLNREITRSDVLALLDRLAAAEQVCNRAAIYMTKKHDVEALQAWRALRDKA